MENEEKLQRLINELIEIIQASIQEATDVHSILKKIEQEGFTLNLSMLIGIFIRDKDGVDMFFSSLGNEESPEVQRFLRSLIEKQGLEDITDDELPFKKARKKKIRKDKVPPQGRWTDKDKNFLKSLGIRFDNS